MTSIGWPLRVVRGAVLTTVALLAGAGGHALAGGALPGLPVLAGLLVALTPVAALLVGRRVDALQAGLLLVLGQAAVHLALMVTADGAHHGVHDGIQHGGHGATPTMLLAHLAAAGIGGLWLAAGERALWTVLDLALVRLVAVLALRRPLPVPGAARVVPAPAPPALRDRAERRRLPARAPPRLGARPA
ncbi:hypothetical protein QE364_002606 [Nocardioides zeae]|uniref:Uncharacterized protein n=1 Tax=Nocardioides zeae TaxID=1457234 RepID=A0ACC6IJJ9_9ACTN|nr:hypothetical protein [Nocardioides zeae]MDR6173481.1 hypothetical protein [Nocardioides zeae]MDR6210887.1 hypothetical protein [Nocardioides zeae]